MNELRWAAVPSHELNVWATLRSGQTFRWTEAADGSWAGVIGEHAVLIRPCAEGFWWRTWPEECGWQEIYRYFALDIDLAALYARWIRAEPRIEPAVARYSGLRIVRQQAEEAFFSFLCASCNTIVKITRTIQALERRGGRLIAELDGRRFYRFPTPAQIAAMSEADLRADLWGYRAPRLIELARYVDAMGPGWLDSLRALPYREAHCRLAELFGIGAKIADCICLFGLGHDDAVPIDTHIRRIAARLYAPGLETKTLTPRVYWQLADRFRMTFGDTAGWAQQYLFLADLPDRRELTAEREPAERRGS